MCNLALGASFDGICAKIQCWAMNLRDISPTSNQAAPRRNSDWACCRSCPYDPLLRKQVLSQLNYSKRPILAVWTQCRKTEMMAFVDTNDRVHEGELWTLRNNPYK